MYDFITFGSATRDVFVRSSAFETHPSDHASTGVECCFPLGTKIEISELALETGGGATNASVTFSRLGNKTGIISCVGNDPSARDVMEVLEANGVDVSMIQKHPTEQTAYSLVTLVGGGERTILVFRGAAEHIASQEIPWSRLKSKWYYITSLAGRMELLNDVLDAAERYGTKVAWNPGSRELKLGMGELEKLIRRVDVFNLNVEEAMHLLGTTDRDIRGLFRKLSDLPKRALIITDGLNGAYGSQGDGNIHHVGTVDVPRINVTGAGDAFGSGLVAALADRDDMAFALSVGTWNATEVVQTMGAKRGLISEWPTEEQCKQIESDAIEM